MQSLAEVSLSYFRNALNKQSIRVSQIIFIGLAAGVIVFSIVLCAVCLRQSNIIYNPDMIQTINMMSIVNVILMISSISDLVKCYLINNFLRIIWLTP